MANLSVQDIMKRGWRLTAPAAAPRYAEYALTVLIGVFATIIFILIFAPLPTPKGDALAAAAAKAPRVEAPLAAINPFPKSPAVVTTADVAPDVADTSLDLTLTGVWPAENGGSAIIRMSDGKEKRFAVGDQIVPGAVLAGVYGDQVIIDRNGAREALRFEKKAVFAPVRTPVETPQNLRQGPVVAAPNPADLSSLVRFGPGTDADGNPAIAIFPGSNAQAFTRMGFRARDVLRRINGAPPPANPGELPSLLKSVIENGGANIVVERDGVETTIVMSLTDTGNQ
ncbi:MAG: type II secretion system protein N [Parvularculaceae bacterium]